MVILHDICIMSKFRGCCEVSVECSLELGHSLLFILLETLNHHFLLLRSLLQQIPLTQQSTHFTLFPALHFCVEHNTNRLQRQTIVVTSPRDI